MDQASRPGGLTVGVNPHASGVTVTVGGDLDLGTSPTLIERASAAVEGDAGLELTLDLSGVGFCDSAGISALVGLRQRCDEAGWVMRVIDPQPAVRRVLVDFTGLGDYLNVI